ncbi:cutinase family protein [Canibacter sp. lx-45]|uniref:cutinase family protein n=1 Tax=Canibacter zhuwentaonis TaxID=2837491 RepID=UPI001BDBD758|nr:cutinase family protein [Canibacter zhuwentaonis]
MNFAAPAQKLTKLALVAALLTALAIIFAGCSASTPNAAAQILAINAIADREEVNNGSKKWDLNAHPASTAAKLSGCSAVLLITARGTDEPLSRGNLLSVVANKLTEVLSKAQMEYKSNPAANTNQRSAAVVASKTAVPIFQHYDLEYPATAEFGESAPEGMRKLTDTLENQARLCPEQKILLAGYSQGAFTIAESLTAPSKRFLGTNTGLPSDKATANIAGIILYGDPRFVASEPYAYGSFKPGRDGIIPRLPGTLDRYADIIRNYCVAHDIVCQAMQQNREDGHVAYFHNGMQDEGAKFLLEKLAASYEQEQ